MGNDSREVELALDPTGEQDDPWILLLPPHSCCFTAGTLMGASYLWLVVVLHRHGDDIDPDDEGDEEVEVVAGAEAVDVLPCWGVVSVVRSALGFCGRQRTARG